MQTKFILICLLTCNVSFAQYGSSQTVFNNFVIRPEIAWAGYAYTYIDVDSINFNKLLLSRFFKNEIRISPPNDGGPGDISKDSLDEIVLYPLHHNYPMYDSNGNAVFSSFEMEPYEIDTTTLTSTNITQILYIENGILKSYIPWVSPSIVIVKTAQTNEFIGYSEYFSTCYNYKFNYQSESKSKNLYLGGTNRKLRTDTLDWGYFSIKELYRKGLWQTLVPYVWDNKVDIFTLDSKIKLRPEQINDSAISRINTVPELENYYDSSGKFIQNKYYGIYPLEDFKEFQLEQDWYYNYEENIVFNKIKALYLCAKKWTRKGEDKEASPILKIVFR